MLAEDNHAVLKKALEERIRTLRPEDVSARFDSLFVRLPDGTVRNRPEGFDGTRMPGVFVPRGVSVDADLRRRILAAYDVLTAYGPAFHVRFTDTYITLPEGAIIIYWPERPTWIQDVEPGFPVTEAEYLLHQPAGEQPASGRRAWTGVYEDAVSKTSMVTVSTPLDLDGRHVATISHDVLLERADGPHHQRPPARRLQRPLPRRWPAHRPSRAEAEAPTAATTS